mmetsp:Transcript_2632/g.5690  ORF Transcript_2632/g.5690 Transcript_2632/m.5690 type:complete len:182 (+) Transcript_2632:461-1006(+)|eukprot:CAMPEP_0113466472 /NCGR_PEP_ID=MMETSP0014_2-20120614/14288_1 /TAXON_ID=2857 /ORGANISM="Nitzschia sp." /LENGTH=181 /DNA_ID=CAMNT_0000358693 /DNA_START=316 /DNA_END=861 /DNA_ORIENTATION=- /assembly_acc=CAM_ASM_000159
MPSKTTIDVELGEVVKNEDVGLDPTVRDDIEDKTPSYTEEEEKTESKSSSASNKSIRSPLIEKIALFLILFIMSATVILAITLPLVLDTGDSDNSSTSIALIQEQLESESGQGFPSSPLLVGQPADQDNSPLLNGSPNDLAIETVYPVIDEDERRPHYGSSLSRPDDATINIDGTEDDGLN